MTDPIIDNKEKSRFELAVDDHIVFANYRLDGEIIHINYVEAPAALRGSGAAGKLMEGITTIARDQNKKLHPICSYAVMWLQRHKEFQDLVA